MSGAGAGGFVIACVALWDRGSARPMRWLVTIAGEILFSCASTMDSAATTSQPPTRKKVRTGIPPSLRFRKKCCLGSTGLQILLSATDRTLGQSHAHLYLAPVQTRARLHLSYRHSCISVLSRAGRS